MGVVAGGPYTHEHTHASRSNPQVRTASFESKFHLVDLAGSERVKRSGVTGQVGAAGVTRLEFEREVVRGWRAGRRQGRVQRRGER